MEPESFTLINPQNGNLAFKIFLFDENEAFDKLNYNNYYSLVWITEGSGKVKADFYEYGLIANSMFAFSPYQPFMFSGLERLKGVALHFHPDFFCIHKHQTEIACNGILFNNIFHPPFILVNETAQTSFHLLIDQMKREMQNPAIAQYELLVSYLKIFLITASRLKAEQQPDSQKSISETKEPFILQDLKDAIETNFKTKHSANEYASVLNISAKALAKITKNHFSKTLTSLIAERIIIEAKRELYLSNKPVKAIAHELGYRDEYYFSRFFKTNAGISPQIYRNTVGFGRALS